MKATLHQVSRPSIFLLWKGDGTDSRIMMLTGMQAIESGVFTTVYI